MPPKEGAGPQREPATKLARADHHPTAAANDPDMRDGNKNKFAWFYEMLADPTVSLAAKVVGTGCCMKMAGRKGHFKATRKAIANLCGISQSTVRRGLADLIDKRFLTADMHEGAASTYYLILPAQRLAQWLAAEQKYKLGIARWLHAEKEWRDKQSELSFEVAVFNASIARGADDDHAYQLAKNLVAKYRAAGLDLAIEQGLRSVALSKDEVFTPAAPAAQHPPSVYPDADDRKRAGGGPPESRGRPAAEPGSVRERAGVGPPESRGRLTPTDPTSANDRTHKSFKDSERPVKVFQESETEPALRNALDARSPRGSDGPSHGIARACPLCDDDGIFRDAYGSRVVLIDDDAREYPVECKHAMAANLAHIQHREETEDRSLCRTDWPEIDSHYPEFRDDDTTAGGP